MAQNNIDYLKVISQNKAIRRDIDNLSNEITFLRNNFNNLSNKFDELIALIKEK